MRILITGASGFIGRHLVRRLVPHHEVAALGRSVPPEGAELIRHDLARPPAEADLPKAVDAVVHLAQSARYKEFPEGAEDVFAVNVASTFGLLEHARRAGARAFVLASTGGVYAFSPAPIGEDGAVAPSDQYFRSKYAAELLLANYARLMRTVALRFFFVYGPGQARMLVPRLADQIEAGREIAIQGDPGLRINPIYVDDAVAAIERALSSDVTGVVNVAGEEALTLTDLTHEIAGAVGRGARIRHDGAGPDGDLVADISRLRDDLRMDPATPLTDGLRRFAAARS